MAEPKRPTKKKRKPKPWHSKPTPMTPRFLERIICKHWTPEDPKHPLVAWTKGRMLKEAVREAAWRGLGMATRKHVDTGIRQVDAPRRRFRFIASQEAIDRDGDVILAQGIEIGRFLRNPVLLQDHDPRLALGKVTALSVEKVAGVPSLVGEAELLPPGIQRVDEIWASIQFGARGGISIGFLPLQADRTPVLPGQRGVTHRRVELLEISVVSIPSCPGCLITEKRAQARAWAVKRWELCRHVEAGVRRALQGRR